MKIIDLFDGFKNVYNKHLSIDQLIEAWYNYMQVDEYTRFTCINDYQKEGINWIDIAKTKVFNQTHQNFHKMVEVHNKLLDISENVIDQIDDFYDTSNMEVYIVLYHGLGNAAGWAHKYNNKPAVFLGIDKICELGWTSTDSLETLLAHEVAHLVHFHIRKDLIDETRNLYVKGLWQLYTEGFAQYYQDIFLGRVNDPRSDDWIMKCNFFEKQLKMHYLHQLRDPNIGCRDFYGDWFKVLELSDTGYYLGRKLFEKLTKKYSFLDVANLPFIEIEREILEYLSE
ncbi:hypothetical protein RJG79_12000 [Mycoplasmatota bacterium WC44]